MRIGGLGMGDTDKSSPHFKFPGDIGARVISHEVKIGRLNEQLSQCVLLLKDVRGDVKILLADSAARKERDATYDRWVRLLPVLIPILTGICWLIVRVK